jgi:transposase
MEFRGLSDEQWQFIQPLLPPKASTGRPRADDRRTLGGILDVLVTGCRWMVLPRQYALQSTAWWHLKERQERGV